MKVSANILTKSRRSQSIWSLLLSIYLSAYLSSCDNNLKIKTVQAPCQEGVYNDHCAAPESAVPTTTSIPKVITPGDDFIIEGSTFQEDTKVSIDGVEVDTYKTDTGEIGIRIPKGLATKKLDISVVQGNVISKIENVYLFNEGDFPLFTASPSAICNRALAASVPR